MFVNRLSIRETIEYSGSANEEMNRQSHWKHKLPVCDDESANMSDNDKVRVRLRAL